MKTVKEKLDSGLYFQLTFFGGSEEYVRREILKDLMTECGKLEEENIIYAMFLWGEVIKQYTMSNES